MSKQVEITSEGFLIDLVKGSGTVIDAARDATFDAIPRTGSSVANVRYDVCPRTSCVTFEMIVCDGGWGWKGESVVCAITASG